MSHLLPGITLSLAVLKGSYCNWFLFLCLHQARSTLYLVRKTLAEFSLHVGNMKFNTQNEE